ncbi:unnamed protein product, partial [Amoebophrya sp. A120]
LAARTGHVVALLQTAPAGREPILTFLSTLTTEAAATSAVRPAESAATDPRGRKTLEPFSQEYAFLREGPCVPYVRAAALVLTHSVSAELGSAVMALTDAERYPHAYKDVVGAAEKNLALLPNDIEALLETKDPVNSLQELQQLPAGRAAARATEMRWQVPGNVQHTSDHASHPLDNLILVVRASLYELHAAGRDWLRKTQQMERGDFLLAVCFLGVQLRRMERLLEDLEASRRTEAETNHAERLNFVRNQIGRRPLEPVPVVDIDHRQVRLDIYAHTESEPATEPQVHVRFFQDMWRALFKQQPGHSLAQQQNIQDHLINVFSREKMLQYLREVWETLPVVLRPGSPVRWAWSCGRSWTTPNRKKNGGKKQTAYWSVWRPSAEQPTSRSTLLERHKQETVSSHGTTRSASVYYTYSHARCYEGADSRDGLAQRALLQPREPGTEALEKQ